MDIPKILNEIQGLPGCRIIPATNQAPKIEDGLLFPLDLKLFYSICNGVVLFEDADYPIYIVSVEDFVLANPVIVGERCEEDISSNWYIIAHEGSSEFITIDLDPKRSGRCYDSFYDRHGVVGESQIIAESFSDLLIRLVENKGQRWYWLRDDFVSLGDAYDEIS